MLVTQGATQDPPLRLHSFRDGTIYQEAISKRADPDEEIQRYGDRLCRDSGFATEVSRTCVRWDFPDSSY